MNTYDLNNNEKLLLLFKESHQLQRKIAGRPSNNRLEHAISIFTAQSLKAYTIWAICNPLPRNEILENNGIIHDFPSGYVLSRSMYETILVSRFPLLDEEFVNSRNAIVLVAILHGYREQNLLLTNMQSKNPKFEEIKAGLKQLKEDILKHPEYISLPQYARDYTNRDDIPNQKWFPRKLPTIKLGAESEKISVMEELALRAGFHASQHLNYYKYFSNYVHSEPFALNQIGAVRSPEQSKELTNNLYSYAENFLSVSLDIHLEVCKSEGIKVSISDDALEIIKLWKYINSEDMAKEISEH